MRRARSLAGWIVVLGAVGALAVSSAQAKTGRRGVFLGGVTSAGWPVVLQMSRNFKTVKQAVIGIGTVCTSGRRFVDPDRYRNLRVSRSGRFSASFGPQPNGNPAPGISETAQGSISGRFNKARTKVSGTWRLTFIDRNAAGVTTDTCDSGSVAWHARQ